MYHRARPWVTAAFAALLHQAGAAQSGPTPGSLRPAAPDEGHWRPTWSPDGMHIAYSALDQDGDYEIFVVTVADGVVRKLTDNQDRDWRPKWSPDGVLIAFSSDRDGNGELYTLDPELGVTRRLTRTAQDEDRMAWSPDGQRLAYDVGAGGEWDLWILDLESSETRRLTRDPGFEGYPDWSNDGTIVFNSNMHDPAGGSAAREIYTLDLETGVRSRLTDNDANDQSPAWSPDGSQIAYFSTRDGNAEIYVMRRDGTEQMRLTNDPDNFMPAWSPDGSHIAFDSRRDGRRSIYVMKSDGSNVRKLTNHRMSDFIERVRLYGVERAVEDFRRAVSDGGQPDMFFLELEVLAAARHIAVRQPIGALRLLDVNLEAHRVSLVGWTALGDLLLETGLMTAARTAFLRALAIDPQHAPALTGLTATAQP